MMDILHQATATGGEMEELQFKVKIEVGILDDKELLLQKVDTKMAVRDQEEHRLVQEERTRRQEVKGREECTMKIEPVLEVWCLKDEVEDGEAREVFYRPDMDFWKEKAMEMNQYSSTLTNFDTVTMAHMEEPATSYSVAVDNIDTMLADANTLLTGVDTASVDTKITTFKMQGSNLDSIMQVAKAMELDLQKPFEISASKPRAPKRYTMGPKRLPDELLPALNKDNIMKCRKYRKNKKAKLDMEQAELKQLKGRNQKLRQEEEEISTKVTKLKKAYLKLIQKGMIK